MRAKSSRTPEKGRLVAEPPRITVPSRRTAGGAVKRKMISIPRVCTRRIRSAPRKLRGFDRELYAEIALGDVPGTYGFSVGCGRVVPPMMDSRAGIRPRNRSSGKSPDLAAEAVSALEEPVAGGPDITVSGSTVSFTSQQALTTVQLTATRCPTQPNTGK